ncbi:MAG TPA: 5'-nucleotidase C-terminal domain-containing protein [Longimicrobiaceae bacterium]|nr:5'-nucleotidase C-terminal domain-containing protein [Longimicrobiaceae bacterium]
MLIFALAACAPAAPPAAAPGPVKRVRIVHTNDFHGRLLPQTPAWAEGRGVGGAAVLAAHFDSAEARFGGPTLVLSGGDDMQGTAVSNLSWGRATIDAHNAAGYDAAALGNHEFDWGLDTLRARVRQSRFPWLAANVYLEGTERQPEWIRPWVMLERDGVKVAVVGAATVTTPEITVPSRIVGLRFGPEAPAVSRAAREARAAGADFVVVTLHVGAVCAEPGSEPGEASRGCRGEVLEMAEALTEPVDLIVGGHTHRRVLTTAAGIPVSEAASYSTHYSLTDLERRGGRATVARREVRIAWADEVDPDTAVARVVERWTAEVRPVIEREVTRFAEPLDTVGGEFALGGLIADAHRRATGAQVSLVNNGSIRRPLPAGVITYGMLYELQPFQNELVVLELTGAQLRAALENAVARGSPDANLSGLTVTYDPAAPEGSRVRSIRLDHQSRELGDADRVTAGLSEFLAQGGDRYASLAPVAARRTGVVDLDALIAHLRARADPLGRPLTGRWVRGGS